jgi:exonuclease VII small subunit
LFCFSTFLFFTQLKRQKEEASRKAKVILETTTKELEKTTHQLETTTLELDWALKQIKKLESKYENLLAAYESLSENLQEVVDADKEDAVWSIRDTKAKGKPLKDTFVGHCR